MSAPQFCSLSEAAAKLGMTEDDVKTLARDGKLREFRDRGELFFKAEEVEALIQGPGQTDQPIELDDSSVGGIALSDESATDQKAVEASSAGDSAIADSALGGSALGDSSIGASHAGTQAGTEEETGSSVGEYDLSGGSSLGLSGTDLMLEPPSEAPSEKKADDQPGVGLSGSGDLLLDGAGDSGPGGAPAGGKEDTVITSVGISVFDDDEIEIDVDPLAKTQVTPSVEDQISLEGVGSGSGLLDLTRESDDTSLGAELLDEIYPGEEESTMQEDMPTEVVPGMGDGMPAAAPGFVPAPGQQWTMVAAPPPDATAPGFMGMMIVGVVMLGLTGTVLSAAIQGVVPSFLGALYSEWYILVSVGVGLSVAALLVGWLVGKQMVGKKAGPTRPAPAAASSEEEPEEEQQQEEGPAEEEVELVEEDE